MSNLFYENIYGNFVNRTFADIFPNETTFIDDYKSTPLYSDVSKLADDKILILYYLYLLVSYIYSFI